MNKQLNLLAIAAIFASYLEAATEYIVGPESGDTRFDTIRLGSTGGFHGFINPSANVKALYITLVPSGTAVEANITRTFPGYDGTGSMPYLPSTVKDVYIQGDASDWATVVLGNSGHSLYGPTLAPSAYGLPTPASGTTVHFRLTHAPSAMPGLWFQGPLLATLVIHPGSADPYLGSLLPAEFGYTLNSVGSLTIQRHPGVPIGDVTRNAAMDLADEGRYVSPLPPSGAWHSLDRGTVPVSAVPEPELLNFDFTYNSVFALKTHRTALKIIKDVDKKDHMQVLEQSFGKTKGSNIYGWLEVFNNLAVDPEKLTTNPRRDGQDFTQVEYMTAAMITKIASSKTQEGYLNELERVFSTERSLAIYEKMLGIDEDD